MRALVIFAVAWIMLQTGGCQTRSSYVAIDDKHPVKPASTFSIGGIRDKSDFMDRRVSLLSVDPVSVMTEVLRENLEENGAYDEEGEYCIILDILKYSPGSAWIRWLFPGEGAAELSVYAIITDHSGNNLAALFVERSISIGGGYTIGAWRYVFNEVANEVVELLRSENKRRAAGLG